MFLKHALDSPADAPLPKGATKRDMLNMARYQLIIKAMEESKLGSASASHLKQLEEQAYSAPQSHPSDQAVRANDNATTLTTVFITMPDNMSTESQ